MKKPTNAAMLIGEYRHTFDDKRRIALPAKFRTALGKQVVITHGLDSCLFIFSIPEWKHIVEKMERLSMGQADARAFGRYLFSGATDLEVDNLGRILVPEYLAKRAGLKKKAVLVGVNERLEVWSETNWDAYQKDVLTHADRMAEKLGDIGIL